MKGMNSLQHCEEVYFSSIFSLELRPDMDMLHSSANILFDGNLNLFSKKLDHHKVSYFNSISVYERKVIANILNTDDI